MRLQAFQGCAVKVSLFVAVAFLPGVARPTAGADKTDVVVLLNGDRITCEVKFLQQGQLQVKTDDMGTLEIEWNKIREVTAKERFDVETVDGAHYYGSLAPGPASGELAVAQADGSVQTLKHLDVVWITLLKKSVWSRIDGSLSIGLSYTQSSSLGEFNLSANTSYRTPRFGVNMTLSSNFTVQQDKDDTQANLLGLNYVRYLKNRWLGLMLGSLEQNSQLGLALRGSIGPGYGRYLVQNNKALFAAVGGMAVSRQQPIDGEATTELDAVFALSYSLFLYDTPKTKISVQLFVYPGLTDWGRIRMTAQIGVSREIVKDFTVGLSGYESYDNQPPPEAEGKNDWNAAFTVGWTF